MVHEIKNFKLEAKCSTVLGQTWFQGNKAIWWQVAAGAPDVAVAGADNSANPGPSPSQDTLVEELLRGENEQLQEEERQRCHLQEQHNPDQVSPWLQTTGWLTVFAGRSASLADLAQLVRMPSMEEARLQLLAELLNDYVVPQCLETLRITPHPYRTWLKSPQEAPQNSSTLKKYTRYWVQYICFVIRSCAAHLEEEEEESDLKDGLSLDAEALHEAEAGPHLTSQQYSCLQQMHRLLRQAPNQSMEELEDEICQQLASQLFQYCLLSVRQQLHLESPYKSSLMYFLAHMGIDAARNTFREPQTYKSILAGVLYISRLFVLEYTLSASGWLILNIEAHEGSRAIDHEPVTEETPLKESTIKAFQVERKNWLVQGKNTPIGALLRLLAYGKMFNRM
ncbi:MAG: hypothetical protein M1829_002908 [Trizodia sp. TS-e1964]|nr:MAG: hypothetical protein M1829_002908 [Trizodia sp. TS-e1964]